MQDDLLSPDINERTARQVAALAKPYGRMLRCALADVFGEAQAAVLYPAALMLLADEAARGPTQ